MKDLFRVNPSFEVTLADGGVVALPADEVFFDKSLLAFGEPDEEAKKKAFTERLQAFLNAAFEQGWVYWTTIAGYPVFTTTVESALKNAGD